MDGINLSLLPALTVVEQVDYEAIVADIAERAALDNASPSDPAYRVALAGAYREMLLRQDANEQARGLMLAYAKGSELDHIGSTYYRNADGSPVTRLEGEADEDYAERLQLSPEGLSVAGPEGAYEYNARSADPDVKDAKATCPAPCEGIIYVLSRTGDGTASPELCARVYASLWGKAPMGDLITVNSGEILRYQVTARLIMKEGPDPEVARQVAQDACRVYVESRHRFHRTVVRSALDAALTVEGVEEVVLEGWEDIRPEVHQVPYCTALDVTYQIGSG
ncbi:baseplate assembly protein [Kushneria pakistanensis]|uniref:Baseplate assembly protein n=1 Tax=Kushneria pakistanensis TaxID=1508770 RepID=A0ABQ3FS46_9GAMM|nr:baseplate J/gp47 family protein [Kushneria pakistanensis]GHC34683.1 baseplate assembly protein [Kushneria pakistanensis]